jgi:hypothetical protein
MNLAMRPTVQTWGIVVAAIVLPLLVGEKILGDGDTFYHLATGNWILEHGTVPRADPFSHTVPGLRWIDHGWLSQVVLALSYKAFALQGMVLVTLAMLALALGMMNQFLLRYLPPIYVLALVVIGGALVTPHLLARPHMMGLAIAVAWTIQLVKAREEGRTPPLWMIPLMVLWANVHGSFIIGLGLTGMMGFEAALSATNDPDRIRNLTRWGAFGIASGLAAFATPNGLDGVLFPFQLSSMETVSEIIEWKSPNFRSMPVFLLWIIGVFALGYGSGVKLPWTRIAMICVLMIMALTAVRHIEMLALLGPILAAPALGPQIRQMTADRKSDRLDALFEAAARPAAARGTLVALGLLGAASAAFVLVPMPLTDSETRPVAAVEAARAAGVTGNVFNDYGFGSYLIFAGVPPYIDGRMDMYGAKFARRFLDTVAKPDVLLPETLTEHQITWTLLGPKSTAVRVMDRTPGWHRIYADEWAVVHVRDPAPASAPANP